MSDTSRNNNGNGAGGAQRTKRDVKTDDKDFLVVGIGASDEELQAMNEQLVTVNQELKIRIEELSQSNNEFQNLINSTDTGTVFLDRAFRVRMFTPAARDIFNLVPTDLGRPLSDITSRVEYRDLIADAETVLEKKQTVEREVETHRGKWYLMRISPYRAAGDRSSGVVVTFFNITERKRQEDELRKLNARTERQARIFNTTLSTIPDFAYIFDRDGRFTYSNRPLLDLLGVTLEEIIGKNFFELNYPEDLAAKLQRQIQQVFDTRNVIKDEMMFTSPTGATGFYEYIFSPVIAANGSVDLVAGSTRDVTERKAAEESIRFQARLLNTVEESVIATDLDGTVIYWNHFAEKLYGWTAQEAAGRRVTDLTTPQMMAEQAAEIMSKLRQGESWNGEFQVQRRDGMKFTAHVINSPIEDNQGKLIGIVGASIDITERKQVEEKLRRSEAELRLITDSIPSLISYVDKTERYRFINAGYEEWFKQPREQIIGRTLEDVLGAAYLKVKEYARRALAGETVVFESKVNYPQGQRFVLAQYVPDTDASGEVRGFYAHVTDIGESKRAEEALRESEERLRLLIESATDYAIFTTTLDNRINSWNSGAEKVFGFTESEIIGQSGDIIFTPEDRAADVPRREIEIALREGRAPDERFHIRKDGSRFFANGVMTVLKNDAAPQGFVKIARDMTERQQMDEQLHRAHEELENRVRDRTLELAEANVALQAEIAERKISEAVRVRLLRQLVTSQEDERRRIARDLHDHLGQQMTALRLKIAALKEGCGANEKLCGQIEDTQQIAGRLDSDIDFLAWELRPAALDDLGLVSALSNYVREWSEHFETAAEFHSTVAETPRLAPEIETNLYRITQEALNNIEKHANATRADVLLERRDGHVVLIVEDDGDGFDLSKKSNIDPTTKGSNDRGLGLIGMHERAALVSGTVEIESEPGAGTTVYARIPIVLANV